MDDKDEKLKVISEDVPQRINDYNSGDNNLYQDNSFDNQGLETSQQSIPNNNTSQVSPSNIARGMSQAKKSDLANGLARGTKRNNQGESNLAKGNNNLNDKDNNALTKKNNSNNLSDRNPALGHKLPKADNKGNQMPGAKEQDKKGAKPGEKNKAGATKGGNPKKGGAARKALGATPVGRGIKAASEASRIAKGLGGGKGDNLRSKIRNAWAALPLATKIMIIKGGIVVTSILIAIVLISLVITALIGGTTAAIAGAMCSNGTSSMQNGIFGEYAGGADVTEFLCKMQSPLGNQSYIITSKAGEKRSYESHPGIDLAKPQGTPVYAVQSGTVTRAGLFGGYGYCVDIDHGSGISTRYGHMPSGAIKVKKGDRVGKGQRIGSVGSTGRSTGPHLHFEIRINGNVTYAQNAYFGYKGTGGYEQRTVSEDFKRQCGSSWEGDPTGDSANAANDSTDVSDSYSSATSENGECCTTTTSSSISSGNYCPNGITVTGKNAGTYNIDEYIAKVVTAENGGAHPEALKALAIAARTYAINLTNNCKKTIKNSTANQVMAKEASEKVKNATSEVAGAVMLYNGNIFSAQYSSFWGSCSGGTCTSTFIKTPSNEKKTYSIPSSYVTIARGHQYGLSQNGSNYMAHQGKKYDEILKFFYADGIEITGASGSSTCSLGANGSFSGKIWDYAQSDYSNAYCGGTIANSGCGPTSMAMIVSTFLNKKHDPPELAKIAKETGHCSTRTYAYFEDAAKKYGLTIKQTRTPEEVLTALNRGDSLVIANVRRTSKDTSKIPNNYWTSGGHYIVIAGHDGDKVWVQDPNKGTANRNNKNGDGVYDFNKQVVPAAVWYAIFTKS